MNQSQQIFGEPSERVQGKVRPYLHEWIQDFIKNSPFLVMASSDSTGACDASPKGGKPGFVKILDEKHLVIPDVAGNRLFQSYENIESNPQIGLIFFIPGIDATVRVNGKVKILRKGEADFEKLSLEVFHTDDNSKLLQAVLLEVVESYSHCPRANLFSSLWDGDIIQNYKNQSPIGKRESGV